MKEVLIDSFVDFDDAMYWLEQEIMGMHYEGVDDIKGEILYVNRQWRVSVTTEIAQGELFD